MKLELIGECLLVLDDCLEIITDLPKQAAIVSDPPYGMKWDTNHSRFIPGPNGHGKKPAVDWKRPVIADNKPFDPTPWLEFNQVILWGANHYAQRLPVGTSLVWLKRNDAAFGTFLSDAEIGWMKHNHGVYCHRDLSMYAIARQREHPTQKPVGLMRWCIQRLKAPALIIDPYMGSGSTGVAAVQLGLPFVGIEIDPQYYEVACKRIGQAVRGLFTDMKKYRSNEVWTG